MLVEFLEQGLMIGGDSIEMEYEDGKLWITVFRDCLGVSIGSLKSNSDETRALFKEMKALRKRKGVTIGGVRYRLIFSEQESFGETMYQIQIQETKPATSLPASRMPRKR
jgi:hypothetical protein